MNNIKTEFSIKDLENLSGIKAHTIRIWEKRYNLLQPNRSDTNIRSYNIENLQKLLNVAFLNQNGYKISKISKLKVSEIPVLVRDLASNSTKYDHAQNAFKIAMFNFDQVAFNITFNNLIQDKSFKEIFYDVLIPLLNDIGTLWQTKSITPAHERFISNLIKQKILLNIEKVQNLEPQNTSKTAVLFLPINEIHEIGLLFIYYELVCKGYHCIYLGESVPLESLDDLKDLHEEITFISYFTVKPELDELEQYIKDVEQKLLSNTKNKFFVLGKQTLNLLDNQIPTNVLRFNLISDLVKNM